MFLIDLCLVLYEGSFQVYGQKLKLGDAHVTPRNIQEVQASKLGDASEEPLLHRQKSGHLSTHYILLLHALCIFLGASVVLVCSFL
jgi:hypothetical protein